MPLPPFAAPSTVDLSTAPYGLPPEHIERVETTLAGMTRAQKVGQLLCLYLRSDDMSAFTGWLEELGLEPGAVMMLPRPLEVAAQDVAPLQSWSRIPLLVAANLESGAVNFLTGIEAFANPMQVAATGRDDDVDLLADHCIRVARRVGITWAFAPVVRHRGQSRQPDHQTRSFGADPSRSRAWAHAMSSGSRCGHHDEPEALPRRWGGRSRPASRDDLQRPRRAGVDRTFGAVYRRVIEAGARFDHGRTHPSARPVADGEPHLTDAEVRPASPLSAAARRHPPGAVGFHGLVVTDNSAMAGYTTAGERAANLPARSPRGRTSSSATSTSRATSPLSATKRRP